MHLASTWYERCKKDHLSCNFAQEEASILPYRILEIYRAEDGQLGVTLVNPPSGSRESYVALSYCWGGSPIITLTEALIKDFASSNIPRGELPPTFRDAIALTHSVGIRYLWIDALCIVQDSQKDWEEQSSAMFDVFSRAFLVIGAASGQDCQYGLFNTWTRSAMNEVELKSILPDGSSTKCFTRPSLEVKQPLHTRSWAFQESCLAKRYISFGSMQMEWNCRQAYFDESGNPMLEVDVPAFEAPLRRRIDPTVEDVENCSPNKKHDSAFGIWQYIVQQYCRRYLTFPKDKFPAMAGLAQRYAKHYMSLDADRYLAGLWLTQLPQALLWTTGRLTGRRGLRTEDYRAPTWSWACIDYDRISWLDCSFEHQIFTTVLRGKVHLLGENPYGKIQGGELTIEGPVKRGLLLPDTFYGDPVELWAEDSLDQFKSRVPGTRGARLGHVSFDLGDHYHSVHKTQYVHCLRITKQAGLVIEPQDEGENLGKIWKRAGIIEFFENSLEWWHGCGINTLTLI